MTIIPGSQADAGASFLGFGGVGFRALYQFEPVAGPYSFPVAESVSVQFLPHVSFTHALARSNEAFFVGHRPSHHLGRAAEERVSFMGPWGLFARQASGSGRKQSSAARSDSA